jgi:hypothetical protein
MIKHALAGLLMIAILLGGAAAIIALQISGWLP